MRNRPETAVAGLPVDLWERSRRAPSRWLIVDLDGTLAPFDADRDRARPLAEALAALRRVASGASTRVAVVSGRPLAEISARVDPLRAWLYGEHGWSRRSPDGTVEDLPAPPAARERLAAARAAAESLGTPARLEAKRTALVAHTRGLEPSQAARAGQEIGRLWKRDFTGDDLELRPIDGGLELRLRGRDKGTAVRELLALGGVRAFAVYIGDDETDEDAFRAVAALGGVGLRVGTARGPTAATGTLPDTAAVAAFLARWPAEAERAPSGEAACRV